MPRLVPQDVLEPTGPALWHGDVRARNAFVHGDAHVGGGSVASGGSFNNMNALIGSAGYTTATDTIVDPDSFQTIGMRQSALAKAASGSRAATMASSADLNVAAAGGSKL